MKKDRFGKSKGPLSKVEIEREAQRELERLSRGSGGRPAFTPPGGPPTALDDVADSVRGRSARPPQPMGSPVPDLSAGPTGAPQFGGIPGGRGAPPPSLGPNQPFYDDDEEAADESANVTEIALRDHAARFGSDPEDLVIRQDPFAAEMMRDQAMRQFLDQQQAKEERPHRGPAGDPVTSVLNRLAARKKAEEEALARGDDGSGETVLDRIRARRDAILAEDDPPPPRQLHEEPAHRGRRPRPRMTMVDDDDDEDGGEDSALAIMRARAEARRPRPPAQSRVYAVPEADEPDEFADELDQALQGDDDEFADEDEALEMADEFDEDEDEVEDEDEGEDLYERDLDAPPTPDFAAEVARLSGGRTMGTPRPKKRPGRGASSTSDAARRTSPAAPKRKAKAPATKAGARSTAASNARTTRAPAPASKTATKGRSTRSPATKSRPTGSSAPRAATAKPAPSRAKATPTVKKTPATRTQSTPGTAPPAARARTRVKAKAAPARAKAAPVKAKAAPARAKAAPVKPKAAPARAKAAPAKAKATPAKAKAAPARAKAVPAKANAAAAAAAKKASAKAKIAEAAKRARSRR